MVFKDTGCIGPQELACTAEVACRHCAQIWSMTHGPAKFKDSSQWGRFVVVTYMLFSPSE